jgi:hypothetical protein
MNINLAQLIKACERLGLAYTIEHTSGNLIEVHHNQQTQLFLNWSVPLNTHTIAQLCTDKEYFYQIGRGLVPMPTTEGYVNPFCQLKFQNYVQFHSFDAIVDDMLTRFALPVIIKKNRGSTGINVFLCHTRTEVVHSLNQIFDRNSNQFDYVALAQEYIPIAQEYRVIYLNGVLQFAYEKNIDTATFTGNLSRLHWEGARAIVVQDQQLLDAIHHICAPLFTRIPLRFCGLDIARDSAGQFWLIEANAAPGFDRLVQDGGGEYAIELYEAILRTLFGLSGSH